MLQSSEEREVGIFDYLDTVGQEKLETESSETEELELGSLECEGLAVRRGPRMSCQIFPLASAVG